MADIQSVLEKKCIPLSISGSGDEYEGKSVRTIPLIKHKLIPNPGELVVNVSKHKHFKQITINTRFLKPWKPVAGGEVVIVEGSACGKIGKVTGLTDQICTVRFEDSEGSSVQFFKPEKLAYIESLRSI